MEKKNKKTIVIAVTVLLLVTLILLGLTYAYYRTRIVGNEATKSISVSSKKLEITYDGDDDFFLSTDKWQPGATITKTFTVENTGDATAEDYVVYLTDVYNLYERQQDIVWTLTCESVNVNTGEKSTCNGVLTQTQYPKGLGEPGAGTGGDILVSNDIPVDTRHEYELIIEYLAPDVDQSIDMGKTLEGRVVIYNYGDINPFSESTNTASAYTLLSNSINVSDADNANGIAVYKKNPLTEIGDIASGIMYEEPAADAEREVATFTPTGSQLTTQYWTYATGYTFNQFTGYDLTGAQTGLWTDIKDNLVGKYLTSDEANTQATAESMRRTTNRSAIYLVTAVNGNTVTVEEIKATQIPIVEATISEIQEGNGTSYYYRGAVTNNYVDFAGMCWRIVRIKSDGSIKLILEDIGATCANSTSTGNYAITYNNQTTFNYGYDSVTVGSKNDIRHNYLSTSVTNSIANAFKSFQTTTLATYTSKLVQEKYCIADEGYADKPGTTKLENPADNYGVNYVYYDSYVRLHGSEDREPTLECNGTEYTQFADGTAMYVGTLTADEVVLAGGAAKIVNDYYLVNLDNSSDPTWWTLSPTMYHYGSYFDSAYYVSNGTELNGLYRAKIQTQYAARPSVTLASNVTITGTGTKTNPYVVG